MPITVKSSNELSHILAGYHGQFIHIGAGLTGRVVITPKANKIVVLFKVMINTSGAGQPVTLTDSGSGIIAEISAGTAPTHLPYNLNCIGNLVIENTGALDLTVTFHNR